MRGIYAGRLYALVVRGISAGRLYALVVRGISADHLSFLVMRGLMPRIYPLRRPDGVEPPPRIGPRNTCAGDWKQRLRLGVFGRRVRATRARATGERR